MAGSVSHRAIWFKGAADSWRSHTIFRNFSLGRIFAPHDVRPDPECRYVFVEPFFALEYGDPVQIGEARDVLFRLDTSGGTRKLKDFARLAVLTLKSFDPGRCNAAVSVGVNQAQSTPEMPKGFHSSVIWRGELALDKSRFYLLKVSSRFADYRMKSYDGTISFTPLKSGEAGRYRAMVQLPECDSLKVGVH